MTSDGQPLFSVHGLKRAGIGIRDFELAPGEAMAVLGPSGSGKSLFLRALADLDPNEGDLRLDGEAREAMSGPQWRRRVIYVPAESGWWAERVAEHFESWDIAAPWAEGLDIPAEAGGWPVSRLSTGERQRLALVRAMAQGARVLLLDEPTSGLDVQTTWAVEARLREFTTNGGGLIFVTHDPDQARRLAGRCLRFAKGGKAEEEPCR